MFVSCAGAFWLQMTEPVDLSLSEAAGSLWEKSKVMNGPSEEGSPLSECQQPGSLEERRPREGERLPVDFLDNYR